MHQHSPTDSVEDGGPTLAEHTKRGFRLCPLFGQQNLDGSIKYAFVEDGTMEENNDEDEQEIQAKKKRLAVRMEYYEQKMTNEYLNPFLCFIKQILRNCPLELIRTFGLGSFKTSERSAYQLVLLEAIKDHFGVPTVTCQDPVTSLCEKRYLQGRGITVLPADDLLTPPPVDVRPTGFTLLYMFHCVPEMYDNVFSYYLRTNRLKNVILIGNDPNEMLNNCHLVWPVIRPIQLPHLSTFASQSVVFPLPKFELLKSAIRYSFISYLDKNTGTDEQNNEDILRK